ncbi:MAG: D-alanyl-D-alanine carboxypeptidase/D-alanyl-D-alanine-endopeptidase [Chitinivibrionales bacterium]|nr:D-alanyl-D-alanine carboxypeptidase/D-alanyl-D-alanine-endopeptidase [Chitinivibrionales bacterium]
MKKSLNLRYAVICVLILNAVIFGDSLVDVQEQDRLAGYLRAHGYPSSGAGVLVSCLETDSVLVSMYPEKKFIPASVAKLITAAVAFEKLGGDFTFKTQVYVDGAFDRLSGALKGDLYIRGMGDPGLYAERMWLLVKHMYHRGLRKIEGDLILDDFYFDSATIGPGFDDDHTSRSYQAPAGALSAGFNCIAIHARPGDKAGDPVLVDVFPPCLHTRIIATAKTVENQPVGLSVTTKTMDDKTAVQVFGSMSVAAPPRYIYRKSWQTWEHFGRVIAGLFQENAITFNGQILHAVVPDSVRQRGLFHTFESEPLTAHIESMLKYSSNFAAEMLFKTIAAREIDSLPGSWERASTVVKTWWQENGLADEPVIANGSGMGKVNALSPAQVVSLLRQVWRSKNYYPDFLSSLSVAGVDGTLKRRFVYSPLKGILRAKTGTLNDLGVSTLAGYVLKDGFTYAFAVLINSKSVGQFQHWQTQEHILELALFPQPKTRHSNSNGESASDSRER